MMKKKLKLSLLFLSSLLLLAGCSLPGLASTSDDNTVAITGGITSEAQILGSIVADMVEHYTDKKTNVINNLATTTINHQAMLNGDASISAARYTGTDVTTTLGLPAEKDPKKAFNLVQSEFEKRYHQTLKYLYLISYTSMKIIRVLIFYILFQYVIIYNNNIISCEILLVINKNC